MDGSIASAPETQTHAESSGTTGDPFLSAPEMQTHTDGSTIETGITGDPFFSALEMQTEFWVAIGLGCVVTLIFAMNEFEKATPDLPGEFRPAELTTQRQYLTSFVFYVAGLEVLYVAACLLGPRLLAGVSGTEALGIESAATVPLTVALVLIGVLPRVRFLDYIEVSWRRLMHRRAAIPGESLQIVRGLRHLSLARETIDAHVARAGERGDGSVVAADLEASPGTAANAWVRLSVLVGRLNSLDTDPLTDDHLDTAFLDRHVGERARILGEYEKLARAVGTERGTGAGDDAIPPVAEAHAAAIAALLERVYLFLACALVTRGPHPGALAEAKIFLGFVPMTEEDWSRETDHALRAIGLSVFILFVLVFVAPSVEKWLPSAYQAGWPADPQWAMPYAISALLSFGAAILIALKLRRAHLRQRRWFRGTSDYPESPLATDFLRVGVVAFVGALVALFAFDLCVRGGVEGATLAGLPDRVRSVAPFAITPAVVGLFVCVLLDGAYLERSKRWTTGVVAVQVAVCAGVAGIAGHLQDLNTSNSLLGNTLFAAIAAGTFAFSIGVSTARMSRAARSRLSVELEEEAREHSALLGGKRRKEPVRLRAA